MGMKQNVISQWKNKHRETVQIEKTNHSINMISFLPPFVYLKLLQSVIQAIRTSFRDMEVLFLPTCTPILCLMPIVSMEALALNQ